MSQNEQNVPNFTVPQLVLIGDAIHSSKTAVILADNKIGDEHNVTVVVRGHRKDLVSMMYQVLKSNDYFEDVVSDALVHLKMEKIQASFDKFTGGESKQ